MKIYTKTGDDGTTGLFGGGRVQKSDLRIECYGTVDELNAHLGVAAAGLDGLLAEQLARVQSELFDIGAHLATPSDCPHRSKLPRIDERMITRLEAEIDAAEAELPPLRQFILPGGCELAGRLHVARTVCRRAERCVVGLMAGEGVRPEIVRYLNRLSDWLFVMARLANKKAGVGDVEWRKSS